MRILTVLAGPPSGPKERLVVTPRRDTSPGLSWVPVDAVGPHLVPAPVPDDLYGGRGGPQDRVFDLEGRDTGLRGLPGLGRS